jgi:hypothetical protein
MNKFQLILCLTIASVGVLLPGAASASVTYTVTANTSAISGVDGYLDLQLEPGPASTNLVTASVTDFTTTGTLLGAASLTGDVTGQLPATLSFDNGTVFNDYFQAIDFGSTENFTVTLNGPTPLGEGPSAFNISFYAADGATPLLTVSPDGEAGQIVINPDGSTTVATFASGAGLASALTISAAVSAIPEPTDLGLGLPVVVALVLWRKRLIISHNVSSRP